MNNRKKNLKTILKSTIVKKKTENNFEMINRKKLMTSFKVRQVGMTAEEAAEYRD